jgi:hypothetical protein
MYCLLLCTLQAKRAKLETQSAAAFAETARSGYTTQHLLKQLQAAW